VPHRPKEKVRLLLLGILVLSLHKINLLVHRFAPLFNLLPPLTCPVDLSYRPGDVSLLIVRCRRIYGDPATAASSSTTTATGKQLTEGVSAVGVGLVPEAVVALAHGAAGDRTCVACRLDPARPLLVLPLCLGAAPAAAEVPRASRRPY